jgi:DNA-binding MarR family transcriptional regulator
VGDGGQRWTRWDSRRATVDQPAGIAAGDVHWLVAHLRGVVAASPPAVWAGQGMTLLQLTAMHFISALTPVSLIDLGQALSTRPPATSAMVDRLVHAGLVSRRPDPHDRRRVELTLTADAQVMIGDTSPATARRLHAVLNSMSPQLSRHVIDVLRDTVGRSTV